MDDLFFFSGMTDWMDGWMDDFLPGMNEWMDVRMSGLLLRRHRCFVVGLLSVRASSCKSNAYDFAQVELCWWWVCDILGDCVGGGFGGVCDVRDIFGACGDTYGGTCLWSTPQRPQ
jgi:hypothetical protein